MMEFTKGIYYIGVQDPNRRTFDALMHLPDGTSYNAYLVQGSAKTALIDTVDPSFVLPWLEQLKQLTSKIDYIVVLHAEQDHSGSILATLKQYPEAKIVTNQKCRDMLKDHLGVTDEQCLIVPDKGTLDLGDKTLEFFFAPWVHWPESMFAYVQEDKVIFTTDFLGAHETADKVVCVDRANCIAGAQRYFAEIMMPFRNHVKKYIEQLSAMDIKYICPSHGPIYDEPKQILEPYREWAQDKPSNKVVIAYVTMHETTRLMANYLADELRTRGVTVDLVDLEKEPSGQLAMHLVDAATVLFGTPAVLAGAHPVVASAALLANALRPKTKFFGVFGSFGWAHKAPDQLNTLTPLLTVERLAPVYAKGLPKPADFVALQNLAETIAQKHQTL